MKMTELDRQEWCKKHKCTEDDCQYMNGYCRVSENMYKECAYCTLERSCKRCSWALNKRNKTGI